jgi:Protein required for attachment to host cells.
MSPHYIVIADHAHLRIFTERTDPGQTTPALDEVFAFDFTPGRNGYTDNDTDRAGRFQSSKHQGVASGAPSARTGMSIDERLPMQREAHRRAVVEIAGSIETFFLRHPDATWDFAAGPSTHNAILERLPAPLRQRLRTSRAKDLVNQPVGELRERFLNLV